MRMLRVLLAAATAAAALASPFAASNPRHNQRRRLTERDDSGGEMHLSYEAVPRAGAIVLDNLSSTMVDCDGHEQLTVRSQGAEAKELIWHLEHADHNVFLVSSTPLFALCGLGATSPWYAQVTSSSVDVAGQSTSISVRAFSVNATDVFEKSECLPALCVLEGLLARAVLGIELCELLGCAISLCLLHHLGRAICTHNCLQLELL